MYDDFTNDEPRDDEPLSDDPEEQLRIENDLLHLQLRAEIGNDLNEISGTLPPELEHAFLSHILEFERQAATAQDVRIYDRVGKPICISEAELSEEEVADALDNLLQLLEAHQILVTFEGDYNDRTKYKFIVDELMEETIPCLNIEGLMCNFVYESFHPNYRLEIQDWSDRFFACWMNRDKDEIRSMIASSADSAISEAGDAIIQNQINLFFDAFTKFRSDEIHVEEIDIKEEGVSQTAIVKGNIGFEAHIDEKEKVLFNEPFEISLVRSDWDWKAVHIQLPGLNF